MIDNLYLLPKLQDRQQLNEIKCSRADKRSTPVLPNSQP